MVFAFSTEKGTQVCKGERKLLVIFYLQQISVSHWFYWMFHFTPAIFIIIGQKSDNLWILLIHFSSV